jgi:hypothetical protein
VSAPVVAIEKAIDSAVPAEELMASYEANEVRADRAYKNQRLAVKGLVDKIGKDLLGTPYVTLKSGELIQSVQVMFNSRDEGLLADLRPGQAVVLQGTCTGKMWNVILEQGTILRQ